jgi:hypothetical protein
LESEIFLLFPEVTGQAMHDRRGALVARRAADCALSDTATAASRKPAQKTNDILSGPNFHMLISPSGPSSPDTQPLSPGAYFGREEHRAPLPRAFAHHGNSRSHLKAWDAASNCTQGAQYHDEFPELAQPGDARFARIAE